MSIKNLQAVINQENQMRVWSKKPLLTIDTLNQLEVDELVQTIDCRLSPENLHCDGEISRGQAQAKYKLLVGALKYLKKLGWQVNCYEVVI